jgi:hypothetical protein
MIGAARKIAIRAGCFRVQQSHERFSLWKAVILCIPTFAGHCFLVITKASGDVCEGAVILSRPASFPFFDLQFEREPINIKVIFKLILSITAL